jgi:hypothetical protein
MTRIRRRWGCGAVRSRVRSVAILGASGARKRSTVTVPVPGCSAKKAKPSKKK